MTAGTNNQPRSVARRLLDYFILFLTITSGVIALVVWVTGWQSMSQFLSGIGLNLIEDEEVHVEIKSASRLVHALGMTDLISFPTPNGGTVGYAVREGFWPFRLSQLVKTRCTRAGACDAELILNIPRGVKNIDALFLDISSNDFVAINRLGQGLYFVASENRHYRFSLDAPCQRDSSPDSERDMVFTGGALKSGTLNMAFVGYLCRKPVILSSENQKPVEIGYPGYLGSFSEVYVQLKFGPAGHVEGWAQPSKLSLRSPPWMLDETPDGLDMAIIQKQWAESEEGKSSVRKSLTPIIANAVEQAVKQTGYADEPDYLGFRLTTDIIREDLDAFLVGTARDREELLYVLNLNPNDNQSQRIYFVPEGFYIGKTDGNFSPMVRYGVVEISGEFVNYAELSHLKELAVKSVLKAVYLATSNFH